MSAADAPDPDVPARVSDADAAALFDSLIDAPALVLAVSGGPDSTALLVLAARWRAALARGPRLLAVTVDHGLRPESADEARAVAALANRLGVPHRTMRWLGPKPTTGIQEQARAARYALLGLAAREEGADHILTAHTLDDQAETVLFRLARGSGLTGLAGIARVAPLPIAAPGDLRLVRPFLMIAKERLIATLTALAVPFVADPGNDDPRFTRARLRRLLPALAAEGLDAAALARLAARMRRADEAIEAAVDALASDPGVCRSEADGTVVLDAARWAAAPAELRLRLLGRHVEAIGHEGPVELAKLEACAAELAARVQCDGATARFRRTLAGAVMTLARGLLVIAPAPLRRTPR